jgi:hypothetical protein
VSFTAVWQALTISMLFPPPPAGTMACRVASAACRPRPFVSSAWTFAGFPAPRYQCPAAMWPPCGV